MHIISLGVPKCGAEKRILGALEGGESASVLLGVDYEKAFNRMDHAKCIEQLRLLGATPGSVSLVRAFLEGRRMTISIDGQKADVPTVGISRGSPQGSRLQGCLSLQVVLLLRQIHHRVLLAGLPPDANCEPLAAT